MLQVAEKDRVTWDSVFQDPMIRLDEDKIRKNLEVIKRSEDHQWRSISLN
jgi:serine/threonine-protein kinase ULK/ATG1